MLRTSPYFFKFLERQNGGPHGESPRGPPFRDGLRPGLAHSAGPACTCPGPSLSRHGAVEEGHDLRPGAGRAGLKGSGSGALGHSALHGPGHRVRIVRTFRHVPEVMRPGCRGRALGPPQQHRRLERGCKPWSGAKAVLVTPEVMPCSGQPTELPYSSSCRGLTSAEGILLFGRLRRAVCPPQEGHKLGPCASAARGEGRSGDTGGDPLLHSPPDRIVIVRAAVHIL